MLQILEDLFTHQLQKCVSRCVWMVFGCFFYHTNVDQCDSHASCLEGTFKIAVTTLFQFNLHLAFIENNELATLLQFRLHLINLICGALLVAVEHPFNLLHALHQCRIIKREPR